MDVTYPGVANNPYSFVGLDWHWTLWMAFFNVALPAAAYYQFYYSVKDTVTSDRNALMYIMNLHAALWVPVILLSVLPGAIPAFYL